MSVDGIQTTNNTDTTVITVTGSLDKVLSPKLEKALKDCVNPVNNKLYIDLQYVPSIEPDGVRVLINASIHANGYTLGLKNPNGEVIQLLNTVGLSRLVV